MCMVLSLITEKEEVLTYCVFVQWGQGAGALSVQVSFFVHDVVRAHVRVVQTVSVSSCGAHKYTHRDTRLQHKQIRYRHVFYCYIKQIKCSVNDEWGNEQHNGGKKYP